MPVITVEGPKTDDLSKKRDFVEKVTEAASEFYSLPEESIIILMKENRQDNVSVGGKLLTDKK
ncbi:4-oxalocrotonate tautomerase [Flexistipes sinusarabici DSM 4947]|uniref:4-oxalocrotonate tautomerase n=1 Tax=Flexistipes sinusarabici (strain ATCC 49648 / DSM 4947 / MAS 10) TaxID=717231 RepID=F8E9M2_FLESM|nr:4-oxalocrotonate tautomerase DmpI [Flexistipes sinusarabici]AEI15351.1 4-oxalocrotonate tautomerase [Flexistipes sinusarabici DSM 4947]